MWLQYVTHVVEHWIQVTGLGWGIPLLQDKGEIISHLKCVSFGSLGNKASQKVFNLSNDYSKHLCVPFQNSLPLELLQTTTQYTQMLHSMISTSKQNDKNGAQHL